MITHCEHKVKREECVSCKLNNSFELAVYILECWGRKKIVPFAKYLLSKSIRKPKKATHLTSGAKVKGSKGKGLSENKIR